LAINMSKVNKTKYNDVQKPSPKYGEKKDF
jgi:hypothetical protein